MLFEVLGAPVEDLVEHSGLLSYEFLSNLDLVQEQIDNHGLLVPFTNHIERKALHLEDVLVKHLTFLNPVSINEALLYLFRYNLASHAKTDDKALELKLKLHVDTSSLSFRLHKLYLVHFDFLRALDLDSISASVLGLFSFLVFYLLE